MARISNPKKLETTWDLYRDIEAITEAINTAKSIRGLTTVIFLREYHNSAFDVARRMAVFENFRDSDDVVLVFERTLHTGALRDNHIEEKNELKSSDDGRNSQIVSFLKDHLEGVGSYARTIAIFFGGLHEPYIKGYIERTFPHTLSVNWTVVSSMREYVEAMPPAHHAQRFVMLGTKPVGYNETKRDDHRMQMLEKGRVVEGFNVDITSAKHLSGTGPLYAIFFIDKKENEQYRQWAEEEGVTTLQWVRMNGANRVVAKLLKRENVPRAETGTLKDTKIL